MSPMKGPWRVPILLLGAGAMALLLLQIGLIAARWQFYLYDFRAFYIGTALFWQGQDAYDFALLADMSFRLGLADNNHPFIYHPLMLYLYRPLTLLPYQAAALGWLVLLVLALVVLWLSSVQVFRTPHSVFLVLAAVGLNGTVAAALRAGQMSLVVAALIMLALVLIERGRIRGAASLLLAAALPKLWAAPLIGLLVARPSWQRVGLAGGTLACLIGLVLLGQWAEPESFTRFSEAARALGTQTAGAGAQDGSSRNFLATLGVVFGLGSADAIWKAWVVVVFVVSSIAFFRQASRPGGVRVQAAIAILGLALVLPRIMVYQWVFVLPPLTFFIFGRDKGWPAALVLILVLYPGLYVNRYVFGIDLHERSDSLLILTAFTPLLACAIAWAGFTLRWRE